MSISRRSGLLLIFSLGTSLNFFPVLNSACAEDSLSFHVAELERRVLDLKYPVEVLAAKIEKLNIKESNMEVRIELPGDILFDFDKASIRSAAEPALQQVAEIVKKYRDPKVLIEGFTDSQGDDNYNYKLSQKRAESVRDWLQSHLDSGMRPTTKGWGEQKPVAANMHPDGSDDPEGRQRNRRVEITVKKQ